MKSFGEKLKDSRLKNGLKQLDVAEQLGCAPTSLTNWENDRVRPSFRVLSNLCAIYGISPLTLLDKEYEYSDLIAIVKKQVANRTYEEQIALNFSEPILSRLLPIEEHRKAAMQDDANEAFLRITELRDRFRGTLSTKEIEAIKADYDSFGGSDSDILFAYHSLTAVGKLAFLSMLEGLLHNPFNLQAFSNNMKSAQEFTLARLDFQIEILHEKVLCRTNTGRL